MTQENIDLDEKFFKLAGHDRLSHPDPHDPPDRTPIKVGEVWDNPVTGERATILELPWDKPRRPRDRRIDRIGWVTGHGGAPPSRSYRAIHRG